jgi:hypothetical protein
VLDATRNAWLDGRIHDTAEERALVQELIAQWQVEHRSGRKP